MTAVVGTWQLLSLGYRGEDGDVVHPLGKHATGWITYRTDGRMAEQMARWDRARFSSADRPGGTPEEMVAAHERYIANGGRYIADESRGFAVHHMETSPYPNRVGGAQKRFFALEGSRLTIRTPPHLAAGRKISAFVTWKRFG